VCGNGVLEPGQACDDGNTTPGDGCSATCTVETGFTCTGAPSACAAVCGDGIKAATEACDDGNTVNGDCCSSTCQIEAGCEVEPNNACGQTNAVVLSGSPATGAVSGVIKPLVDSDYYAFTLASRSSVRIETFVGGAGQCTAATNSADTEMELRDTNCTTVLGSDDDDGPGLCSLIDPTVAADAFARALAPGTYYVRVFEHGNDALVNLYQLLVTVVSTCGNGVVEPTEACDDGNTADGDGCSSKCALDGGWACYSEPSICFPPEIVCNDGLDNNNANGVDAADPSCFVPSYFPACAAGQTLRIYPAGGLPLAIPDNNATGITSSITVTDGGTIQRAAILFDITHGWDTDVDMFLTPPGGTLMDINTDNGGSGVNFTNTVLDTTCATNVTAGTAPFSNCYKPETPFTTLNGTSANGTWSLKVADDASAITGTLNRWSLVLCTTP
jgi:cysteine-rich repeat protein